MFRVPWEKLGLDDVRAFLREAGEEGLTWEAKADDDESRDRPAGEEPGRVGKNTIRKAGCGFANQIGGYLILGARWDKQAREWRLPGVVIDHHEPRLWIGQLLRELRPVPRFDTTAAWSLGHGRIVMVLWVEPVDEPPCMTPLGHVYQRVSGETERVRDPALLAALFTRGREASLRATQLAQRAADRCSRVPRWKDELSVSVTVALAPIGRETEDIRARLFVPSFVSAMEEGLKGMVVEETTGSEKWQEQDAYALLAHYNARVVHDIATETSERMTWVLQANWDGAVAASVAANPGAAGLFSGFDEAVLPGWRAIDPLVQRLGGYGPAELLVLTYAAQESVPGAVSQLPLPPPRGTLYARLPEYTLVQRRVNLGEISQETLGSVQRETIRASGRESFEPEVERPQPMA